MQTASYLDPVDDGLLMREAGPWAAEKLDYLARYIDAFEKSMRGKWQFRNYIDLMAGPGKNRIRENGKILLGSPLVALTAKYPFTHYYFGDISSENKSVLEERCSASRYSNRITVKGGDCNSVIDDIVSKIEPVNSKSLNLAFLDPEGFEMNWSTVAKLASLRRIDLIINYPQGGLNRMMRKSFEESGQTLVDLFFGGRGWRKIFENSLNKQTSRGLHRSLIDHYKEKLKALGYHVNDANEMSSGEPLIRTVQTRAPLYRLLFVSKHPLGNDLWQKVTRRDVYGQGRLPL